MTQAPADWLHRYALMVRIRAFEQELASLFTRGSLRGTSHFCIGQEATAVGVTNAMWPNDWLVSNHRGHGHLLARGADATRLFCELLGREKGYCRGKGGSQHLSVMNQHILGTNGITGGGIPIGTGAAWACKYRGTGEAVVLFFGDGASNQGTFHESLNLAALWQLPVLYVCENNGFGMSTPVARSIAGGSVAARAKVYGIPSLQCDGLDVDGVFQATSEALARIHQGHGPELLEVMTWRQCGHSKSDPRIYRSQDEEEKYAQLDSLITYREGLLQKGISPEEIEAVEAKAHQEIAQASLEAQQTPVASKAVAVEGVFASPETQFQCEPFVPPQASPREFAGHDFLSVRGDQRYYSQAVCEALDEEISRDPAVVLMGEDIGCYGGAFGVTRGLWKKYGDARIWETPISENSFTGMAVGASMLGLRPVVEIMFMDFVALALDQLLNSAAKLHYMYDGQVTVPMVIRMPGGAKGGYGPSHSQMLASLLVGIPGLKIVAPSNAFQAKGLLKSAIRDANPVIFIENKRLYSTTSTIPAEEYLLPLDKAVVAAPGSDATLVAYSAMVPVCLEVQKALQKQNIHLEVVDLVSLQPLDTETLFASVRKTGRVVIVEEGCVTGGVGAEVSARITEACLFDLEAPILRVGARDVPIPSSVELESYVLPQAQEVVEAVLHVLGDGDDNGN